MYIYITEDIQPMSPNTNKKDFSQGGGLRYKQMIGIASNPGSYK